jgi:hypothetical protein
VAALKTPVASEGGEGLPGRDAFIEFYRKEIIIIRIIFVINKYIF